MNRDNVECVAEILRTRMSQGRSLSWLIGNSIKTAARSIILAVHRPTATEKTELCDLAGEKLMYTVGIRAHFETVRDSCQDSSRRNWLWISRLAGTIRLLASSTADRSSNVFDELATAFQRDFAETVCAAKVATDLLVGTEQPLQRFFPAVRVEIQSSQDVCYGSAYESLS